MWQSASSKDASPQIDAFWDKSTQYHSLGSEKWRTQGKLARLAKESIIQAQCVKLTAKDNLAREESKHNQDGNNVFVLRQKMVTCSAKGCFITLHEHKGRNTKYL